MKKIVISFILLSASLSGQMPPLQWAKTLFSPQSGLGRPIAIMDIGYDSKNCVYIAGWVNDTVDFDPALTKSYFYTPAGPPFSSHYIAKYSPAGTLIWANFWENHSSNKIQFKIDATDNLYISGAYSGSGIFQTSTGNYTISTNQSGIIAKVSSQNGSFIWVRELPGSIGIDGISVDRSQNLLMVGSVGGYGNFDRGTTNYTMSPGGINNNMFLAKFSTSGQIQFLKKFVGPVQTLGHALTTEEKRDIIVSGYNNQPADIDPGSGTVMVNKNFIGVYDSTGKYKRHLMVSGDLPVKSLEYANGIFACGVLQGASSCNFITGTQTVGTITSGSVSPRCVFFKMDTLFSFSFAREIQPIGGTNGGNILSSKIQPHNSGNLYVFTEFMGPVDFDPANSSYILTGNASYYAAFHLSTSKYDASGNLIWAYEIGAAAFTWLTAVVDNSEAIYTGADYAKSLDVDPGSSTQMVSTVKQKAFISRLADCRPQQQPSFNVTQSQVVCTGDPVDLSATGNASWYYWDVNGTDGSSFTYSAPASNTIEVFGFNQNGCYSSLIYTVQTNACVDVAEFKDKATTTIFPNPTNDFVKISCANDCLISITDVSGKVILKKMHSKNTETELSLEKLSPGIYFLNISDERGKVLNAKKIIKR